MLLSVQQRKELNKIIDEIIEENSYIQWVTEDECIKYKNTEYESMIIGLGIGGNLKSHLQDDNTFYDTELTYYYQKNITHWITVFRIDEVSIKIQVHKKKWQEDLNGSKTILTKIV